MLHAARWKCRTQISPKIGHLGTIAQLCRAISSQLRHVLTIGSSNISSRCPHNMVNFGPLAAETSPVVWGTPANFNGFRVLASSVTARHCSSGRQPNFAALNRGHVMCGSMADIQSATAENRREKKIEDRKKKPLSTCDGAAASTGIGDTGTIGAPSSPSCL